MPLCVELIEEDWLPASGSGGTSAGVALPRGQPAQAEAGVVGFTRRRTQGY